MNQPGAPGIGRDRKTVLPLHPLVGNMWVPVWAIRPGAYEALEEIAAEMQLWLLLHSRNADFWKPCYASREQLGKTIGVGTSKVTRQLKKLHDAGLLWEVDRGIERKTKQHRPPARWALDPFTAEVWRPKVEAALAQVAEEDGQSGRWLARALTSLDAFDRRSRLLAAQIAESMPIKPRRRKRCKKPRVKMNRRFKMNHEGVFTPPQAVGPVPVEEEAGWLAGRPVGGSPRREQAADRRDPDEKPKIIGAPPTATTATRGAV